jgi:hypothetical protein
MAWGAITKMASGEAKRKLSMTHFIGGCMTAILAADILNSAGPVLGSYEIDMITMAFLGMFLLLYQRVNLQFETMQLQINKNVLETEQMEAFENRVVSKCVSLMRKGGKEI